MRGRGGRPRPLDEEGLERLALHYVGRYATTRAKLAAYLRRKVGERGWAGAGEPGTERIVERLAALGYVDDAAFADARGAALTRRGYGPARISTALHAAGIDEDSGSGAMRLARESARESALAFARRRRLGPFGTGAHDPAERRRQIGQMARAGHDLATARAIVSARDVQDVADID